MAKRKPAYITATESSKGYPVALASFILAQIPKSTEKIVEYEAAGSNPDADNPDLGIKERIIDGIPIIVVKTSFILDAYCEEKKKNFSHSDIQALKESSGIKYPSRGTPKPRYLMEGGEQVLYILKFSLERAVGIAIALSQNAPAGKKTERPVELNIPEAARFILAHSTSSDMGHEIVMTKTDFSNIPNINMPAQTDLLESAFGMRKSSNLIHFNRNRVQDCAKVILKPDEGHTRQETAKRIQEGPSAGQLEMLLKGDDGEQGANAPAVRPDGHRKEASRADLLKTFAAASHIKRDGYVNRSLPRSQQQRPIESAGETEQATPDTSVSVRERKEAIVLRLREEHMRRAEEKRKNSPEI